MIFKYLVLTATLICVDAGSSYQFVRFQKPAPQQKSGKSAYLRSSPGYILPPRVLNKNNAKPVQNFQNVGNFLPPDSLFNFEAIPHEISQLSYELNEVYDPYLLTGNAAKQAARLIYGKGELFLDQYPHVRALLINQDRRRANGLAGNRLGSLRPSSPFHRFGRPVYINWYI